MAGCRPPLERGSRFNSDRGLDFVERSPNLFQQGNDHPAGVLEQRGEQMHPLHFRIAVGCCQGLRADNGFLSLYR